MSEKKLDELKANIENMEKEIAAAQAQEPDDDQGVV